MTLDFIQIYYKDEQLQECYNFSTCYRNNALTDYFENEIIATEVPKTTADYIGINSWRLRKKRQSGMTPVILGIYNNENLSKEKMLSVDADIYNLTPRSPSHKMLHFSAHWHGGPQHNFAWDNAIEALKKFMFIPEEVKIPIYENCQVVRSDIYKQYVSDCLIPVMDFMLTDDVFFADSGYAPKKERDEGPQAMERYRELTGRQDYPIAPFILERLFSIWINDKNFKIVNV